MKLQFQMFIFPSILIKLVDFVEVVCDGKIWLWQPAWNILNYYFCLFVSQVKEKMTYPGGDGSPVWPILGPQEKVLVSKPVKCKDLTGFFQPSNNELDFGGCQAFVRVRFLHCAFIKKKRKIMHGFRNTQSSFSAFSFPLYFKKIKRAKENLELLNVHSYPLEKSGVQNQSRN
jgi:hypothetical protein